MALRASVHVSLWFCELVEIHRKAFFQAVTNPDKETLSLSFSETLSEDTQNNVIGVVNRVTLALIQYNHFFNTTYAPNKICAQHSLHISILFLHSILC